MVLTDNEGNTIVFKDVHTLRLSKHDKIVITYDTPVSNEQIAQGIKVFDRVFGKNKYITMTDDVKITKVTEV